MAHQAIETPAEDQSILDRTINLTAVTWAAIGWVAVVVIAAMLRLAQLGHVPLSVREARLAHEAWRYVMGATAGEHNAIDSVGPTTRLLTSFTIFLFGESDGAVRFGPAVLGIAMVLALLGLRRAVGRARALGMAALVMISPTLVYASRTLSEEIVVAAFTLFSMIALLRTGDSSLDSHCRVRWAVAAGALLAAAYGAGASSLSVILAMLLAAVVSTLLDPREHSAFRRTAAALRDSRELRIGLLAGFAVTLLTLFSRFFSDFSALSGIVETLADWGRLLTTASANTPTQFFLLAVLLYELLAVAFSFVAASRSSENDAALPWTFFAVWFAAALLLFSFSSGGLPVHAIHVALPVVLLGGGAIGDVVNRLSVRGYDRTRLWLFTLAIVGLVIAVLASLVLLGRIDDAPDQGQAIFEAGATILIAVGPLAFAVITLIQGDRRAGRTAAATAALLALLFLLGALTMRTSVMLSFYNADEPVELLAQETSTPAVDVVVRRITNIARDTTLREGSARDPEGGRGLTIAIDQRVAYPYRWYLREFPDMRVAPAGEAVTAGTQVVIAPDDEGMATNGYTPAAFPARNRVPASYLAPDFGNVLRGIFFPTRWEDSARFLLFRTMAVGAEPETVTVGMIGELAHRISPATGPFGLFERVGAGSGRGQFNQPRGIAVSPATGDIFVVDMGNARVQRFSQTGEVIDIWGAEESGLALARTAEGLGPTGIAAGADGLIYVADTWNHRVVVLDESGRLVREFGSFANTEDAPDPNIETGFFFGPRGIAVHNDEIYVVDTGNERVQVFALDGTFLRAWGGHGSDPSRLIEPVGIAIDAAGRIYVADSSNARISIFSPTGEPLEQWPVDAWAQSLYFEPYLAFDDNGYLYASSSATGSVEVFNRAGIVVLSIREVGAEPLDQPVGVTWSPDGSLLITDKGRGAVYRFVPPIIEEPAPGDEPAPVVDEPVAATPVSDASPPAVASPVLLASPVAPLAATPVGSPVAEASPIASPAVND